MKSFLPMSPVGKQAGRAFLISLFFFGCTVMLPIIRGPRADMTLLDNPIMGIAIGCSVLFGIIAGIVACVAYFKYHDRSIVIYGLLILLVLIGWFIGGELLFPHS